MKTVLKTITAIIIIPFFFLALFTSFLKFQVLSENFWIRKYSEPGFEQTLNEKTRELANAYVKEQLKKEGGSELQLSDDLVQSEVEKLTAGLETGDLITVLEENTTNILALVNGKTNDLVFYAPLEKFGVETEGGVLDDLAVSPNEYDVSRLLSNPTSPGLFNTIFGYLQRVGRLSTILLVSSTALLLVLLYIYYSISKKLGSLGKFLIVLGILGFLIVIPPRLILSSPDAFSAAGTSEPAEVVTSLFIPLVLSGFVGYAMYFSGGTIALGLSAYLTDKFILEK